MAVRLPTDWTELSIAAFQSSLDLTRGFHDAGFFEYIFSKSYLDVTLHPIYFGKGYEYSYGGLNACKLRLSTSNAISELSLHQACEAFNVMELKRTDSELVFSFSKNVLKLELNPTGSKFKFFVVPAGQDYWSLRN